MKLFKRAWKLALITIILTSGESGKVKTSFELRGHITGLRNDSVFVYARIENDKGEVIRTDTFSAVSGYDEFVLKGSIGKSSYAYVHIGKSGSDYFPLILEPGIINVRGNMNSIQDAMVSGTPENDVVKTFSQKEKERYSRIKAIYSSSDKADATKKAELNAAADRIRDSIKAARVEFISNHPGSMQAAVYLYVLQDKLALSELESFYKALTPRIRNNSYGRIVGDKLTARKRTAIGNIAPPVDMKDINGESISLDSFRGRYVLLDFWASWCVPCREEIPAIKAAYRKFEDKGLVIIAISLDNKEDNWLKAVKEEDLPWINTREDLGTPGGVAQLYGVGPIPDNFLINPEGKIIARGLRGGELGSRLAREINPTEPAGS